MLATYASAALICAGALILGQNILRLCGATEWSWLSGPVGLAGLILISVTALHVPGRASTIFVLVAVLTVLGALLLLRSAAHRPPLLGVIGAIPVIALTALPFLAAGQTGVLGWSFDNDMSFHLLWAD